MLAIPPNRQLVTDKTQARGRTTLITRTIRVVGACVVLAGLGQPCWSESLVSEQQSQQRAGRAVAANSDKESSLINGTKVGPAPIARTLPVVPPLSIADYENYIIRNSTRPKSTARTATLPVPTRTATETALSEGPKQTDAVTDVRFAKRPDAVPAAKLPLRIIVAASTPVHDTSRPADNVSPKTQPTAAAAPKHLSHNDPAVVDVQFGKRPIVIAAPTHNTEMLVTKAELQPSVNVMVHDKSLLQNRPTVQDSPIVQNEPAVQDKSMPDSDLQAASRSTLFSELSDDSSTVPQQSSLRVAKVSQVRADSSDKSEQPVATPSEPVKPLPTPSDSKSSTSSAPTEPLMVVSEDGSLIPITNSSYLPANPEAYCFRCGVKCPPCGCNPGGPGWTASRPIPWEVFAQGEYVGPSRLSHVPVYRLRVDDQLAFVYRLSGQVSGQPYRLNVRDRLLVQSMTSPEVINREVIIQPDGTVTLPLLGQFRAAGSTLEELTRQLDDQFMKVDIKDPRITVTPVEMNSKLQELRSSVDRRYGQGGQVSDARISPDGTVQLPAIGSVPAQGLTLEELEREVKARYSQIVEGLEVTPILTARAPRYVFVVGEVRVPGRYSMEGPTTLMQAVSLAGGWNVGAQLNQVVVFRRDENWQLMATAVNIRESLLFKKPCPSGEIWLRDSDIVLLPKSPILCADDFIELVFTRGIYGVFPMNATLNFAKLSTL